MDDTSESEERRQLLEDTSQPTATNVWQATKNGFLTIDIEGSDPISEATELCEKWVLRWYRLLLKIIGWTPITCMAERIHLCVHIPLMAFWVFMILVAFVTQILSCFRRDTFLTTLLGRNNNTIECNEHVGSAFVITDIPLLLAYGMGVYFFTKNKEYLPELAQKVFNQTCTINMHTWNKKLVMKLSCFLISGIVWILFSVILRIMTAIVISQFSESVVIRWGSTEFHGASKVVCTLIAMLGFIFFDTVYIVSVMNYAAQSEMNVHLLQATKRRVRQRIEYADMNVAIKDIQKCHESVEKLNGPTSIITSLILFNLGSLGLLALISVDQLGQDPNVLDPQIDGDYKHMHQLAMITSTINAILWLGLFAFPFIQAARVSYAGDNLKATGTYVRSRPFEYTNIMQLETDSFLNFTQAIKLRATMFGIPIVSWTVYGLLVGFSFTMLILLQTEVYIGFPYL